MQYWEADTSTLPATKQWYDEIKDYNFSKSKSSGKTGHFTQVVWKSTTKLGCAAGVGKGKSFVVCHYCDTPGNYTMKGMFKKNVLPPKKRLLELDLAEIQELNTGLNNE